MTARTNHAAQVETLRGHACIVGTAGHIDHGKSALVRALTGTDPDRLPEERKRGMTIELGFARLDLADEGETDAIHIGIVDVPGHERFVRTMVAGATGIDLGLLVVAADDGVMPQTREHVEILDLLGIDSGLITISKTDLVHTDRINAVQNEISALVKGTSLSDWSIVPTSAKTGQGLDSLRKALRQLIAALPPPHASSIFRMAIDRVFAVRGRGTVVTGSVLSGRAGTGTQLELQPAGLTCRVRELQSHGLTQTDVASGQRAALNLTGIAREQITRGMELATPGYLTPSRYVDARVRVLPRQERPLRSHWRVRVAMGTTESLATVVVINGSQIDPGKTALVQLRMAQPIVAAHGQRFILRNENARSTLGGGRVLRPVSRRLRPLQRGAADALERCESGDAFVRYAEAIRHAGFETHTPHRIACEAGVAPEDVSALADRLQSSGQWVSAAGRDVHRDTIAAVEQRALAYLKRHHTDRPTEPGLVSDRFVGWIEKRSSPGWGKIILKRLIDDGRILVTGPYVAEAGFHPALSPEESALLERLVSEIMVAGLDVPAWTHLRTVSSQTRQRARMLDDLAKCEPRLVAIGPQQFISATAMARVQHTVRQLAADGPFKLAQVRDALGVSRRVVQPLLEHLDRAGFTRRVGDERILQEKPA
ncbi:MAG: selenocysteine-specific translation elongation factor [Phycisphaerae bacterium]